jgi:hypothetical protein
MILTTSTTGELTVAADVIDNNHAAQAAGRIVTLDEAFMLPIT